MSEHHAGHDMKGVGGGRKKKPERKTEASGAGTHGSAHAGMAGMDRKTDDPAFAVTRAQLVAMSLLTVLALVAGSVFAASQANLTVSAREVGGVVMPAGMVMRRDLPAEAMRDMAAVDPKALRVETPATARGDRPLEPRLDGGVKVFQLEAAVTAWNILPDVRVC